MIAPLCASLSLVLAGPEGCSRGRWRSGPSKWRHTATLGGRGQGAPRTCRCIETMTVMATMAVISVREHHAPVGALRLIPVTNVIVQPASVREHHAPVGALRQKDTQNHSRKAGRQGAPRTCRCIETASCHHSAYRSLSGQGAPRTCRCIETMMTMATTMFMVRQGAPRTCRCIETSTGISR